MGSTKREMKLVKVVFHLYAHMRTGKRGRDSDDDRARNVQHPVMDDHDQSG